MSREQRLAKVFLELADTLVDDFDVLDLLHTLCERSVELLRVDSAALILADPRGVLQVMASTTEEARVLELFVLRNDEGPCLECYSSGHQVVNLAEDEAARRWPRFRAETLALGFRSTHALPLRLRGQVLGVLNLFCVEREFLSDIDLDLAQTLCDIATVGLLQERSVRHAELLAEQLQAALNSRILLEQAKGVLSERAGISVDEAFTRMRSYARRNRRQLVEVATAVVEGAIDSVELGA